MIDEYCREPGVRSLERQTKKLMEKVAFNVVQHVDKNEPIETLEIKNEN